ncbi:hypothetical protein JW868_01815 [Candidatus Woesearchaeota archaeon]|nr:hypothetical protein [Candidatus Woesearchaeota archaeon]
MIRGLIFTFDGALYNKSKPAGVNDAVDFLDRMKETYKIGVIFKDLSELEAAKHTGLLERTHHHTVGKRTKEAVESLTLAMQVMPDELLIIGTNVVEEIAVGNMLGAYTAWFRAGDLTHQVPEAEHEVPTYVFTTIWDAIGAVENKEIEEVDLSKYEKDYWKK